MGRMQNMVPLTGPKENTRILSGAYTIGGSGAITAQQGMAQTGVTFVKNAGAGRYDATIHRGFKRILCAWASIHHPTAGTAPTLAAGNMAFWQGVTAAMFAPGTPTPLPETGACIQLTRT